VLRSLGAFEQRSETALLTVSISENKEMYIVQTKLRQKMYCGLDDHVDALPLFHMPRKKNYLARTWNTELLIDIACVLLRRTVSFSVNTGPNHRCSTFRNSSTMGCSSPHIV
jgi:hypothetical protein